MSLSLSIRRLFSFIKETFTDVVKTLTTKEGLKSLYRTSLYRNAIYLMLNSGGAGILAFVFWILAARFCSAEEVGLASATLAASNFLGMLAIFGLDLGLIRFLPGSGQKSNALVNSCLTVSGLSAIIFSLIFLAGVNVWSPALVFLRQQPFYIMVFTVLVVAGTFYFILQSTFIAQRRADFTLWQSMINGSAKLALVIPLAVSLYAFGIITSLGIGFVVAIMVGLLVLLPRLQHGYHPAPTIRKEAINKMIRFSFANYIVILIGTSFSFVLPLMVVNLLGAEQNAYFYVSYSTVASGIGLIPVNISLSLFAEGSHSEERLSGYTVKSLRLSFLLLIPLIIIVFFAGDKILLLFGKAYSEEATSLLWILALSLLPMTINSIYYNKKRVEKKMKSVIGLSALTMVMVLGLSYVLLPVMGIIGAGISLLVGRGIVTLLILGRWLTRESINLRESVD